MKFKSKLVLMLVFFVISFSAFAVNTNKKENIKVPKLVLYDQYGKKHNMEEYKGKVVVINFWATWCGYCVKEMPEFEKVYKEFGSNKKDVIILGVAGPKSKENPNNVDVEKDKIKLFLKKNSVTYPNLMDETGKYFEEYGIRYFPTTYVINKRGYLEGFVNGAINGAQLKNAIKQTLEK